LRCAVLLLHHSGHGDKERSRGASVLEAGVDAIYQITGDRETGIVCLKKPKKMKDGEPQPDTYFKTQEILVGLDEDLQPIHSIVLDHMVDYFSPMTEKEIGVNEQLILDILGAGEVSFQSLQETFKKEKGEMYKRQNFRRAYLKLKDNRIIIEKENGIIILVKSGGVIA
jgi:hypothetical protein